MEGHRDQQAAQRLFFSEEAVCGAELLRHSAAGAMDSGRCRGSCPRANAGHDAMWQTVVLDWRLWGAAASAFLEQRRQ